MSESMEDEYERIRLEERHFYKLKPEKLADKWRLQEKYIDYLEETIDNLKNQAKSKLESQNQDSTRRENILIMRLASKEQEAQDMLNQIQVCHIAPYLGITWGGCHVTHTTIFGHHVATSQ